MPNLFALMSVGSDHPIAAVKGGIALSILERIEEDPALQPQLTEVMRRAFQKARDVLQLDGRPDDAMTDAIATKIIELVKAGEIDPDRLCSQVLIELADRPSDAEGSNRMRGVGVLAGDPEYQGACAAADGVAGLKASGRR